MNILPALELDERVGRPRANRSPAGWKPSDFHVGRQELAVFHRGGRLRVERELWRALSFGGGVEADDRVADSEPGEFSGHGLIPVVFAHPQETFPNAKV